MGATLCLAASWGEFCQTLLAIFRRVIVLLISTQLDHVQSATQGTADQRENVCV